MSAAKRKAAAAARKEREKAAAQEKEEVKEKQTTPGGDAAEEEETLEDMASTQYDTRSGRVDAEHTSGDSVVEEDAPRAPRGKAKGKKAPVKKAAAAKEAAPTARPKVSAAAAKSASTAQRKRLRPPAPAEDDEAPTQPVKRQRATENKPTAVKGRGRKNDSQNWAPEDVSAVLDVLEDMLDANNWPWTKDAWSEVHEGAVARRPGLARFDVEGMRRKYIKGLCQFKLPTGTNPPHNVVRAIQLRDRAENAGGVTQSGQELTGEEPFDMEHEGGGEWMEEEEEEGEEGDVDDDDNPPAPLSAPKSSMPPPATPARTTSLPPLSRASDDSPPSLMSPVANSSSGQESSSSHASFSFPSATLAATGAKKAPTSNRQMISAAAVVRSRGARETQVYQAERATLAEVRADWEMKEAAKEAREERQRLQREAREDKVAAEFRRDQLALQASTMRMIVLLVGGKDAVAAMAQERAAAERAAADKAAAEKEPQQK